jgi:tetraacyldisaccharide 4'-kinase
LLKYLLYPFSLLYGLAVWLRNRAFDKGILKSFQFDIPVISVGNLRVGGTGKTPMVLWLAEILQEHNLQPGIVSRGYGRKTKGYVDGLENPSPEAIGDEPALFVQRLKGQVPVLAGAERLLAIPLLLQGYPECKCIVLDDAYQHRYVRPHVSILLTAYDDLFSRDTLLPAGRLREARTEARRADVMVVTRCPINLSEKDKKAIKAELAQFNQQASVYFSHVSYDALYSLQDSNASLPAKGKVFLCTGIANPEPLRLYLEAQGYSVLSSVKADHHVFTAAEITKLKSEAAIAGCAMLVITEKDAVKWKELDDSIGLPIWVQPIRINIDEESSFKNWLLPKVNEIYERYVS